MPSHLAGHRQRELCPRCLAPGGECDRCNGNGYVWVDTYAPSRAIDAPDADELEHKRLRAFCAQHQLELDRLRAELLRLAAPVCCPGCGEEIERSVSRV